MISRMIDLLIPIVDNDSVHMRCRCSNEVRLLAQSVAIRLEGEMYRVTKNNLKDYENCDTTESLRIRIRLLSKILFRRIKKAKSDQARAIIHSKSSQQNPIAK